jgi:tetrapyrrole methylase family protein/MazG family protein
MPTRRKRNTSTRRNAKRAAGKRAKNRARIAITARDRAAGKWFEKLVALQARLYGPDGCPWDREQTHASLRKYLIEETYEVLDAMDSGDPRKFSEELGDLLLQIVFHAILAEETRSFTMSDIIEGIHTKMVRRHPHVFGDAEAASSAAVLKNWEQIKAEERAAERLSGLKPAKGDTVADSIVGGVPRSLPAVLEAYQLTRRAAPRAWVSIGTILQESSKSFRRNGGKSNRFWALRR